MKKIKEKEIRAAELFCVVTALVTDVVCILYLLNIVQFHWSLSLIHILAILLHATLGLLGFVQKKRGMAGIAVLLVLIYLAGLIYYNIGI